MQKTIFLAFLILSILSASSLAFKLRTHSKEKNFMSVKTDTSSTQSYLSCDGPTQVDGWTYSPNFTMVSCNTSSTPNSYLGPYGEDGYVTASLNISTAHNGIIVSFSLALLDSWDGELFKVTGEGNLVYSLYSVDNETTSNTCLNDWDDRYVNVQFGFNHSTTTLSLNFTSTLDQASDDEAWGICNLTIVTSESYVDKLGTALDTEASGEISDLTFSCNSPDKDDAWDYIPVYGAFYCNEQYFVGPFGTAALINAVLSVPDDHTNIIIAFQLALIDSWDEETFSVTADGVTVYSITHQDTQGSSNTCQNGWNDEYVDVQFGFSHNGRYLTLTFSSTLDQMSSDEAWGICNLTITSVAGNVDSNGDYLGTGTGGSLPGSYFSCSSPELSEDWSYSPYYTTTTCNGDTYVGGFGSDGAISGVFTIADDHQGVVVSFNLALLDSWEGESFEVTADGTVVYTTSYDYLEGEENICGASYDDDLLDVKFGFNHTADTLTLVFNSNLDQDAADESWGICDLTIKVKDDYVDADGNTL